MTDADFQHDNQEPKIDIEEDERTKKMPLIECCRCRKKLFYEKMSDLPHFPFCSERCKMIDLGAWLDEERRIPGEETPPDDTDTPHKSAPRQ